MIWRAHDPPQAVHNPGRTRAAGRTLGADHRTCGCHVPRERRGTGCNGVGTRAEGHWVQWGGHEHEPFPWRHD
eukprot:813730-Prymnesium_polylepis.1